MGKVTSRRLAQGTLDIVYEQDLELFEDLRDGKTIGFTWAFGPELVLVKHTTAPGSFNEVDLESGKVFEEEPDNGAVMFVAWAVLCSVGIMASAFRLLMPASADKALWFRVHRGVQVTVVVLCLAGFALAVVMVADAESPHFDSLHKQLGLGVTAIALLQPINAVIRPHPPNDGEKKSTQRVAWEITHKLLGYGGWLLA